MTNKMTCLAAILLASASAFAGFKNNHYVTITTSGTHSSVYGSMGTARNSADSLQYIGCEYYATTGHSQILCSSRTASNQLLYCSSMNPHIMGGVHALVDGALVQFSTDTAISTWECQSINISGASRYAPPQP